MDLKEKYKQVIDTANSGGATNLQINEQGNVLHINGEVPTADLKDKLWEIYGNIDPDFRSGDLILNVQVAAGTGSKAKVVTDSSNLNVRQGPGTDQPLLGKAAHGASVTLLSKPNDQWWLIRTEDGVEGYAYAQYLRPE